MTDKELADRGIEIIKEVMKAHGFIFWEETDLEPPDEEQTWN